MKKWSILALSAVLLLALCACGKKDVGVIGGADGPTALYVSTPGETQELTAAEKLEAAKGLIGAEVAELYEAIGEPQETAYVTSCIGDGADGELYYDGFNVYTYRDTDGTETVQDVLEVSK